MREDIAIRDQAAHGGGARAHRVVVAEDDDEMRRLLVGELRRHGLDVAEARNGRELVEHIIARLDSPLEPMPDAIITDVRMPGMDGLTAVERIRRVAPDLPVILITGFGSPVTHDRAARLGARVLDKPFDFDDLITLLDRRIGGGPSNTPPWEDS